MEPEILLDGEHGIERTFEVAQKVWAEVFFYLAENNVMFEGILLKPSMVTPGAECKDRATPEQVADYTLKLLKRRIPPAVPGIMASFLILKQYLLIVFSHVFSSFNVWLQPNYTLDAFGSSKDQINLAEINIQFTKKGEKTYPCKRKIKYISLKTKLTG